MELQSHIKAKRLWNYLRAIYFMMRKGLISKRKLLMDLNLAMKRRNKVLSRSFTNIFLHAHGKRDLGFGLREYEFSCSNSPSPAVFLHKRRHNYFPCLGSLSEEPDMWRSRAVPLQRIEYSPSPSPKIISLFASRELAPGEKLSLTPSPISIRIVDYSDEEDGEEVKEEENIVDGEAEEFIRRFYEQLQAQNRIALLEYQEREYHDMLARGA
ncbi:hypothetical protein LUZ63_003793 [Rhynchospora breviuscula]|uniref:DUF761 domain-containing protein n=1 Tax=Rhynchospora breviuscula TaxID=2022672 RepID=A0A9Q0D2M7_9POAL|nr:hypothetical protein LUZ63_003793 [Rhynchospora breviuscula]